MDTSGLAADNSQEESDVDNKSADDSIEDEGDADSDAEDVFLTIQPSAIADQTAQGQRYLAMRYLEEHLKEDVTMPFQSDWCSMDCDADLESGISLPPWHCPFLDCRCCWQSDDVEKNHEEAWWQHVWHTVSHKVVCLKSLQMANLAVADADLPETVFALLVAAMTEKERRNPCMVPRVGLSVDRRTLVHLGETTKFRANPTSPYLGPFFIWVRFSKMYSPQRDCKRTPRIMKIQKCSDLDGYILIFAIYTYKFELKNFAGAFPQIRPS